MEIISNLGFTAIPGIVVICYLAAQAAKAAGIKSKWCPIIVGVLGGLLGAVEKLTTNLFLEHDLMTAIAIGIVSGLASTGAHQITKQLGGKE